MVMQVLVFFVFVFLALCVWVFVVYNRLVSLRNEVENSWSGIDVQLKKRADLVPNLVSAVKGYMKHEKEVLENVTRARAAILLSKGNVKQAAAADGALDKALKSIFAVAENYPKLQASENFLSLQNELSRIEDDIASMRRIYNDNVRVFNTKVETIPTNIIANLLNFKGFEYFTATEQEKKNIELDF